jgi:hypothetical protein
MESPRFWAKNIGDQGTARHPVNPGDEEGEMAEVTFQGFRLIRASRLLWRNPIVTRVPAPRWRWTPGR